MEHDEIEHLNRIIDDLNEKIASAEYTDPNDEPHLAHLQSSRIRFVSELEASRNKLPVCNACNGRGRIELSSDESVTSVRVLICQDCWTTGRQIPRGDWERLKKRFEDNESS